MMNLEFDRYVNSPYFRAQSFILNNHPNYLNSYIDSVSEGQHESKIWMIRQLEKTCNFVVPIKIEIIGGWFGFPLIEMLNFAFKIDQIDFFELDETCKKIFAQYTNFFNYNYKISVFDDYFDREEIRRRHLIINTSSEHMRDVVVMKKFYKDYPFKPILVLQSNNYFNLPEHVNCVHSAEELIQKNQIKKVLYSGKMKMNNYTRFMVIGQW